MFSLFFDREHRVLLTRFTGTLRREVARAQRDAARRFEAIEGQSRSLMDFSDLEAVDLSLTTLREMGRSPQTQPGQVRVYVIPKVQYFGMGRIFGAHQSLSGSREPMIYRTMAEAYDALQLTNPDFQPVQF
jgi:hypothetical protein